ncbi:MAG: hypothetical protein Q9159_006338 [Coniocarpon cinnabarinum]
MASNLPNSKLGNNASSPITSPAPPQTGTLQGVDAASRRSGGSGSFGAGSSSRATGQPRKQQTAKNQHKHTRRYRLADEDAIAESAAMRSFTNKKGQTSITHLMNFSLPPRPNSHYQPNFQRHSSRTPRWGLGSGYHAVDKARYVHANYRFIVDPRGDYTQQSTDADVYLDWSSILQILASPLSQQAACPICLSDPVAPRMAKCGHIFCLHCLIRYMHSSDAGDRFPEKKSRWKSCPICWDSMYMSDMRAVRWFKGQESEVLQEGCDIVLRLVVRPAESTLALPKDASSALMKGEEIPWHFAADVMDFARVMRGTREYMLEQYDAEIHQLEQLERHDELMFGDDNEWTQRAIRSCQDAKERMRSLGNVSSTAPLTSPQPQTERSSEPSSKPESALSQSIAQYRTRMQGNAVGPSDYHFYQALQHHYLSALDIKILKASFGSYAFFPSTILPRVERISTGHIVDEDLRRRHKYLSHLPHGCEVAFLECDWTDTVPKEVLDHFSSEIDKRRRRNADKDAREEKERVRAEKEEDEKRWKEARRIKRGPSAEGQRSGLDLDEFQPLTPGANESIGGGEIFDEVEGSSPNWGRRREFGDVGTGSGYAALASPSTSPSASRTVWGTAAIPLSTPPIEPQPEPTEDDGWLQGWEKEILDADVSMIEQMEGVSLGEAGTSASTPGSTAKKKGKKNKKITLMSTSQRRGV